MPRAKKGANLGKKKDKKKGGPDENQAAILYAARKEQSIKDKMQAEMAAEAARVEEAARLKAIEDAKPSGIRPTMPVLKPASWFCHNCSMRNPSTDRFCSHCGRHDTWVTQRPMSERPLHAQISECLRFPQFEVMLETDLKRDSLREKLLLNAGMDKSQVNAPGADGDAEAKVRAQVNDLLVAADIANANAHRMPGHARAAAGFGWGGSGCSVGGSVDAPDRRRRGEVSAQRKGGIASWKRGAPSLGEWW